MNGFLLKKPIVQLLCGPFTGPGSTAMVVTIGAETCWGEQRWAVFRLVGGAWQLVFDRSEFVDGPIVAIGGDIRVTTPVYRPADPRCIPSGGAHARRWHWNGSRLVGGPYVQVQPPATTTTTTTAGSSASGFFKTPSGNIQCLFIYRPAVARSGTVVCGISSGLVPPPPRRGPTCSVSNRVVLNAIGRTTTTRSICPGEDEGDAGPFGGGPQTRVLGYGHSWSGGGIRCDSATGGLTCKNTQGHGFFLSREHWRSF